MQNERRRRWALRFPRCYGSCGFGAAGGDSLQHSGPRYGVKNRGDLRCGAREGALRGQVSFVTCFQVPEETVLVDDCFVAETAVVVWRLSAIQAASVDLHSCKTDTHQMEMEIHHISSSRHAFLLTLHSTSYGLLSQFSK